MRRILTLFLCAAGTLGAQQATGASLGAPEILTVGRGEVSLTVDRVFVTFGVVTHAASAAAAGAANNKRMTPLLAALRRQRLPDSLMGTTNYSVQEDYRDPQTPATQARTYTARNGVRIRLSTTNDLGAIIDSALAAGATAVTQFDFESSQAVAGRQRAIGLAVQDARTDAEAAASASGNKLGQIIEIVVDPDNGMFARRSVVLSEMVVSSYATPILPSTLNATIQVRVRWALVRSP